MARKKEQPKPLFGLKHDFYASLDHTMQQAINLMQVVDQAVQIGAMNEPIRNELRERSSALRAALMDD